MSMTNMTNMILAYELRGGYPPVKDRDSDAGWDLCSCEPKVMMPGEVHTFDLGIGLQWQEDRQIQPQLAVSPYAALTQYGRLAPRSRLSRDFGVMVLGGVVDEYTGNIGVTLARVDLIRNGMANHQPWVVEPGTAIVQYIPEAIFVVKTAVLVERLIVTDRGAKGYGSSGR